MGISVDLAVDREKLRRDIDMIVERLHEKRVQIREKFEVSFVDREAEARKILEGVAGIWLLGGSVVLYGPKGCGKSTFFEKLVESIGEVGESGGTYFEASYVKWDDVNRVVSAVSSGGLSEIIFDAIKNLDPSVSLEGGVVMSASLSLGRFFGRAIEAVSLSRKAKRYGRVLLVMDERSVKDQRDSGEFRAELESLADNMRRANLKYYQEKKGYITAVILTSDALAAEAWEKVGSKVDWLLMWNLPRGDFERLADQLGVDSDRYYRDLLWRLAGGNPRALGDIARDGLSVWLGKSVIDKVKSAIIKHLKDHPETPHTKLWEYIADAAREPLGIIATPLRTHLLADNIIISLLGSTEISEIPRMPSIRRENAYQIPAYYYALKAIARKGDLNIDPEDVIEEAEKAQQRS